MKTPTFFRIATCVLLFASVAAAQEVLPFPPAPSGSTAGLTMQDSVYKKRVEPKRLPADAPNILIVLIDDVGPAQASTYGGEINTPTLTRVANMGISYNRFHTTAMCSPTRASLLCGRNHTRVCNGQIAELANDFDGFSGTIPKSAATVSEVLKDYGYNTGAWGKWHNTPAELTTSKGPFDYWPSGYGFEYFYGFLAGEASQYEPRLVRNTTILDPHTYEHPKYHVSEDLAEDAIKWLREQQAFTPDKPFFMYWAPGAAHGPHQVPQEWTDKYKGKFDDGWDKYRQRAFANAKSKGWIPKDAQDTPRPGTLASWDSIPGDEKAFQRRLMEVYAGFMEHCDYHLGRIIDEIQTEGKLDNTLIFYIFGDNGASAEGQNGTIAELLAQNGIPSTIQQHIKTMNDLGGLDVLGSAKADNMYHAGWAWAGEAPYKGTKLLAGYLGGTRNPMAVSWPAKIKHDDTPRPQFHHVIDIVPTIYEVVGITAPRVVNGVDQMSIDGVSMAYSFADASAKGRRTTQFFDVMGSRGIYHDDGEHGWYACTFGPRTPWTPGIPPGIKTWNPDNDVWELYDLNKDWSQADDLAAKMPEKVTYMKNLFLVESAKNQNLPIGGGLWTPVLHPEDIPQTPYTEWTFTGPITGMPESTAPKIGSRPNIVTMEMEVPENASGVLYALGGFAGGVTCYMKDGLLCYEYNLFEIDRTQIKSKEKLPTGKHKLEVQSMLTAPRPGAPMAVTLKIDGQPVANGQVPITAALLFTANDCLDIGSDLGSAVSLDYFDAAPFKFNGKIERTQVKYVTPGKE